MQATTIPGFTVTLASIEHKFKVRMSYASLILDLDDLLEASEVLVKVLDMISLTFLLSVASLKTSSLVLKVNPFVLLYIIVISFSVLSLGRILPRYETSASNVSYRG